MQDGTRVFGVVAIKAGREVGTEGITALHTIGCTAELRYAEAYEDGRFDIIVTGKTRFRLLDVEPSAPMRADVDLLTDDQSTQSAALAERVARQFVSYREALITAQGMQDESDDDAPELPDDPAELAYLVAAAMILDMSDKQLLLASETVDDRLRLELTMLKREASMVTGLGLRPAVELPRTPYASN
jgi:Lon protease-like protein